MKSISDKLYLIFWLAFTPFLNAQTSTLDSLLGLTKKASDIENVNHYIELSIYYTNIHTENLDSARYYGNKAVKIIEINKDNEPNKWIDAIHNIGYVDIYSKNYEAAKRHMEKVLLASKKVDYKKGLRKGNRGMAILLLDQQKYLEGLLYFEKAYALTKKNKASKDIILDYAVDLSTQYQLLGFNNEASKVLAEAIEFIDHPSISLESKGIFYENMGGIHWENDKLKEAVQNFQKAVFYYKKDNNLAYQILPLSNIGFLHMQMGEYEKALDIFLEVSEHVNFLPRGKGPVEGGLAYVYKELGHPDKAIKHFKNSFEHYAKYDKLYLQGVTMKHVGIIHKSRNRTSKAKRYFSKAASLFQASIKKNTENGVNLSDISQSYFGLYEIDSIQRNYQSGIRHYKNYIVYRDSLDAQHKMKITERLEFAKERAQKDKEILELANTNDQQRYEAKQQRYLQISLVIGLVLVFLLLGLMYNRFRLKKRALKIIEEKNEENTLLMREIHHRVKNNLQIILSLLSAQMESHKDNTDLKEVLNESKNRIQSMAIIHQNLYQGNQFSKIPVKDYLNELVDNIKRSFIKLHKEVQFDLEVDSKEIQMGLAVPLGLIVNELITNCCKYAFVNFKNKEKIVSISFRQMEDPRQFRLLIQDNGKGLPQNFDMENLSSFGMQLIQGLVHQLQGEIKIIQEKGVTFDIYLEEPLAA